MAVRILAPSASLALILSAIPGPVQAQGLDRPYAVSLGPVAIGGDAAAVVGPRDDEAFFNYTDYEHNALRLARVRLTANWPIHRTLSMVGELRTENFDGCNLAGFFLRWSPSASGAFSVQIGRVPPVIGAFARHSYGRDNIVAGAPLAYHYLTALRPDALPRTLDDVLRMRARGWQPSYPIGDTASATGVPMISAFRWDTGIEAQWHRDRVELSGAITRGTPAVPVVRETNGGLQWSGRAALRLAHGLVVGVSGARGQWLESSVLALVPASLDDHGAQIVVGLDAEFGSGPLLVRGEWLRSAFQVPIVSAATPRATLAASSGFIEARYRFRPRWQIAARADRLSFGSVAAATGARVPWDYPVSRLEAVVGFRATRQLEARAGFQQNWRDGGRVIRRGYPIGQVLYWF